MGSSYSDLNLYFKLKTGDYGFPKNEQNKEAKNGGKDNKNQIYTVKVSKSNYQECVNFEKVTHSIEFTPISEGLNYNIILNDSCEKDKDKGKNVFGYYYPSDLQEVLSQLHVYYSVLAPNDPLVVSFVTRGDQTYNFSYSGLLSTRWVRAYSIAYYSLSETLTTKLLTKEFRNLRKNRKIKFKTGKEVVEVSGNKQKLDNDNIYRYIFFPKGNASILGSECLNNINVKTYMPESPKHQDATKPAETSASPPATPAPAPKANSTPKKYNNNIDPYYLDFVNGHHYDGVILYFVIDDKNNQNPGSSGQASPNGGASSSENSSTNGQTAGNGEANSEKYDHNMAVLLELIDKCEPKTHIQRKDKHGNWWSQEEVKYENDDSLKKALKEIQKSADGNESTTFIIEKKEPYVGVSEVKQDENKKITYSKYTHSATATNKPNFLFRKNATKINDFDPSNLKTQTLDIYFLKIDGKEEDWPFIIMFTYQNDGKTAATKPPSNGNGASPSSATAAPQSSTGTANTGGTEAGAAAAPKAADEHKPCKKCYFSSENYNFTQWLELKNDETPKPSEKEAKEKEKQEPKDPGEKLEEKLSKKLAKIEDYGKCQTELYLLRKVAFYVLSTEEPKAEEIKKIELEERPKVLPTYEEKGTGTSLPVVLGSVAGGLVVLGTIGAIIYGIYWYNTTIKLLT